MSIETGRNTERRGNRRIPVSLQAVVYYNSLMLPECIIRDISSDGMFVSTGGRYLPDRARVDLALALTSPGAQPQRLDAEVVRLTDDGVGLRLNQGDPVRFRAFVDTLYAS
jgi:hypothetical protein